MGESENTEFSLIERDDIKKEKRDKRFDLHCMRFLFLSVLSLQFKIGRNLRYRNGRDKNGLLRNLRFVDERKKQ